MSITLPSDGQTDWGDELNTAILQVDADATSASTAVANHSSNIPADPHGDRAYAQSLVNPITSGVNRANGFVQLNSSGTIPAGLISGSGGAGGSFTNIYDAISAYGATPNTGSDQSPAIQSALNACASAGGGEVWVGAGTFSLANYLVVGANTWLHLSEGTIMQRIVGSSTPAYLVTNCQFGTNNIPGAANIMISGGTWDAVGSGITSACTPVFMIQVTKLVLRDMIVNVPFNNPCTEINGCFNVKLDNMMYEGIGSNVTTASVPCVRINSSSTSTTPSGLASGVYNNTVCNNVNMTNCGAILGNSYAEGSNGSLIASDKYHSGATHNNISVIGSYANYYMYTGTSVETSHWNTSATAGNNFVD
jgi:hypothetical protein